MVREAVGLPVFFPGNVDDAEFHRAGQLAADPVQRIEPRGAALVLAGHLLDHEFGVRENLQGLGVELEGVLQGFKEGDVFGHVIVLVADPTGDADATAVRFFDYDADARRPRAPMTSAINVSYKMRHLTS